MLPLLCLSRGHNLSCKAEFQPCHLCSEGPHPRCSENSVNQFCRDICDCFLAEHQTACGQCKSFPGSVQLPPLIRAASLHSKWSPSRKTTTGHNTDINRSWEPSPNRYSYNTAPTSVVQGTSRKRGQNDCKSQSTRIPAYSVFST